MAGVSVDEAKNLIAELCSLFYIQVGVRGKRGTEGTERHPMMRMR